MARVVNRSELAETFGVALSTIDLWIQQGMPCLARPERRGGSGYRIDLGAVLEWHRDKERQTALGEVASVDEQTAKRRKLVAQASLAELELAVKQGQAVAIADQTAAWSAMVSAARAKLLGIGAKLGPVVAVIASPGECQQAITAAVHEALRELSGFDPGDLVPESPEGSIEPEGGDPGSGQGMGPAPAADSQPVGRRKSAPKRRSKR